MGDEKRRRMRRPFLATCRDPRFKSRKKAFGKMLLMTGLKALRHGCWHIFGGQQVAGGDTTDTNGNSMGAKYLITRDMGDPSLDIYGRNLAIGGVGTSVHDGGYGFGCRGARCHQGQHLGTYRRVGDVLCRHGAGTGAHMRATATHGYARGGDGDTGHAGARTMADNRESHASVF